MMIRYFAFTSDMKNTDRFYLTDSELDTENHSVKPSKTESKLKYHDRIKVCYLELPDK